MRGAGSTVLVGQDAAAPVALQILASIDQVGGGWPMTKVVTNETPPMRPILEKRLSIINPKPKSQIISDPDTAQATVQIPLISQGADGHIWWFIDGTMVSTTPATATTWWQATHGRHVAKVIDEMGRSAEVSFTVNTPGYMIFE
jgi:membrane carboxypeptidase/penicillin-binding protein PbpC